MRGGSGAAEQAPRLVRREVRDDLDAGHELVGMPANAWVRITEAITLRSTVSGT